MAGGRVGIVSAEEGSARGSDVNDESVEIPEGSADRSENNLQKHFFHTFRNVYTGRWASRFRGWAAPTGRVVGQNVMRTFVGDLVRGHINLRGLFDIFDDLHKDYANQITRDHMEEIFCEFLDEAERQAIEQTTDERAAAHGSVDRGAQFRIMMDRKLMMGLLGLIGRYGKTSDERYATTTPGSYSYYQGARVNNPGVTTWKYRDPPKPGTWDDKAKWTNALLDIDVGEWCETAMFVEMGSHYTWVVTGVAEAIERMNEYDSFDWLRLMPFISKHGHMDATRPSIKSFDWDPFEPKANYRGPRPATRGRDAEFLAEATRIIGLARDQLGIAAAQIAATQGATLAALFAHVA